MRTILSLAAALAVTGCATSEQANLPAEQAAPSSTLSLTVTDPVFQGGVFDVLVTGANPGDNVQVVIGLGGSGAGACPGALGGNCMDILPPYRLPGALSGTADATGTLAISFPAFPATIPTGTYWLQAIVPAGANSNESAAVSHEVRAPCIEDGYEDNDDQASAPLDPANPFTAVSCDGDDDWFAFTVADLEELTFNITFDDALDGDIDMTLYDAAGAFVDGSGGTTDIETVVGENISGASTTFAAEIYTFTDEDGNGTDYAGDYSFAAVIPPAPQVPCLDDAAEFDGDSASAQVGAVSPISGTSCDFGTTGPLEDRDWVEVNMLAGQTIDATAFFLDNDADIDLFLIDALNLPAGDDWGSFTPVDLAGGTSTSDNETISYTAAADGTYYLVVVMYEENAATTDGNINPTSEGAPYDLEWTITP